MGRPRKTLKDLDKNFPDWKKSILDLYSNGKSDVQVRAWFIRQDYTLSHELWYRWMEDPEFSQTIKKGHILSEAWWQDAGQNLRAGQLNTGVWQINMRNRFGWKDAKQSEGDEAGLLKEIANAIKKSDTDSD